MLRRRETRKTSCWLLRLPGSYCKIISYFKPGGLQPSKFQPSQREAAWCFIWVFSPNANVSLGSWEPGLFEGKTVKLACSSQHGERRKPTLSGGQALVQQQTLPPPQSTSLPRDTPGQGDCRTHGDRQLSQASSRSCGCHPRP